MVRRNIIGDRIRLARKTASPPITPDDLAARVQVQGLRIDRATISKIEIGYREITDLEIAAIAKALSY